MSLNGIFPLTLRMSGMPFHGGMTDVQPSCAYPAWLWIIFQFLVRDLFIIFSQIANQILKQLQLTLNMFSVKADSSFLTCAADSPSNPHAVIP
jgi:hypothetical protein